jgi:hypothetical protein
MAHETWDQLPPESRKWVRVTEWPDERRVAWAIGAYEKVMAIGQARTLKEARRQINAAQRGDEDAGS